MASGSESFAFFLSKSKNRVDGFFKKTSAISCQVKDRAVRGCCNYSLNGS